MTGLNRQWRHLICIYFHTSSRCSWMFLLFLLVSNTCEFVISWELGSWSWRGGLKAASVFWWNLEDKYCKSVSWMYDISRSCEDTSFLSTFTLQLWHVCSCLFVFYIIKSIKLALKTKHILQWILLSISIMCWQKIKVLISFIPPSKTSTPSRGADLEFDLWTVVLTWHRNYPESDKKLDSCLVNFYRSFNPPHSL